MQDPYAKVRCELPGCDRAVTRCHAVPVSVVFDGTRIRGLACSTAHAAEIQRGWSTRDAYGAQFVPVTQHIWGYRPAAAAAGADAITAGSGVA
jgi:hypothetical protein